LERVVHVATRHKKSNQASLGQPISGDARANREAQPRVRADRRKRASRACGSLGASRLGGGSTRTLGVKEITAVSIFTGYLDRSTVDEALLELRLTSGAYWPDSAEDQVLYVSVERPEALPELENRLSRIEPLETELYVDQPATATQLTIQVEYDEPVVLRGAKVSLRFSGFELPDYKRFAQQQHEHLASLHDSLGAAMRKINAARELLTEQGRRTFTKAEGHAQGGTARTLYEQHLTFIARVLRALDA